MAESNLPVLGDQEFRQLQQLMARASGIHLGDSKRPMVAGRLMRRLRALNLSTYRDYLQVLKDPANKAEQRLVIDLLTTNETYFFREPQHFQFFARWLSGRREALRIWSAACSSGEEPYTLAMVLAEHAKAGWSILGTDLSRIVLEKAQAGIYPLDQSGDFPPGWLKRHCLRGIGEHDGAFRLSPELRQHVSFRELNLMRQLPDDIGKFDVIFLRNVLIYFGVEDKRAIVARLLERLRLGGLLFIGHAESLHGFGLPLRSVAPSVFERL